jgi:hypothetical protein
LSSYRAKQLTPRTLIDKQNDKKKGDERNKAKDMGVISQRGEEIKKEKPKKNIKHESGQKQK